MRVIECDVCGEVVNAASDDELAKRLVEHAQQVHPDNVPEEGAARSVIEQSAYEAQDS